MKSFAWENSPNAPGNSWTDGCEFRWILGYFNLGRVRGKGKEKLPEIHQQVYKTLAYSTNCPPVSGAYASLCPFTPPRLHLSPNGFFLHSAYVTSTFLAL